MLLAPGVLLRNISPIYYLLHMIKVQELIITDLLRKGTGKETYSPVRGITAVYSKEGDLIATDDPCGSFSIEDLVRAVEYSKSQPHLTPSDAVMEWARSLGYPFYQ